MILCRSRRGPPALPGVLSSLEPSDEQSAREDERGGHVPSPHLPSHCFMPGESCVGVGVLVVICNEISVVSANSF